MSKGAITGELAVCHSYPNLHTAMSVFGVNGFVWLVVGVYQINKNTHQTENTISCLSKKISK